LLKNDKVTQDKSTKFCWRCIHLYYGRSHKKSTLFALTFLKLPWTQMSRREWPVNAEAGLLPFG